MVVHRTTELIRQKFRDGSVRLFLVVAAVAFWLGGFTFYGSIVIPAGIKVLHGHLRQGFITQEVTGWLNISGAVALAILLWNLIATVRAQGFWSKLTLRLTWAVMAAAQLALFFLHPPLDRLLDSNTIEIIDYDRFDQLHRVYLMIATVQWGAGVLHLWCVMAAAKPDARASARASTHGEPSVAVDSTRNRLEEPVGL